MNLHNFKKIGIIGFAREGRSLLNYLESIDFKGEVFIMDRDIALDYPDTFLNVSLLLGQTYLNSLGQMDLVFKSSGVPSNLPQILESKKKGVEFTSLINLFLSLNKKPIIAVSGTKGKSSTVTFIKNALLLAGYKAELIGNIGNPALDYLNKEVDYYVFEVSSYMLEDIKGEFDYAIFTSFFPDHMDTHGSFENYMKAKFKFFDASKRLYVNDENLLVREYLKNNKIEYFSFKDSSVCFDKQNLILEGKAFAFNNYLGSEVLNNFIGAIELLLFLNVDFNIILQSLNDFKTLPHRQEIINSNDLVYVDDSASITPESTIAAINNFKDNLKVLILGGQNRGYTFDVLNKLILDLNIQEVLVLPELNNLEFPFKFKSFESLDDLMNYVKSLNLKSGVVLFSPGSPSYNVYKNFAERGKHFRSLF